MRRVLIGILTVCLIGVLGFGWWQADNRATELAKTTAPFDWSGVTSRDLNIAAVFLTARDAGVRRAMDSLQTLSAADTTFRNDGHMIAHALGRFAIASAHGDPSVLSQCRPTFQAGCYHGVLEGYLASLPKVDANATTSLCARLIRADSSRFPATECAHGLGHGFAEALGYKLDAALHACDTFAEEELKGECHDGVFMENTVHGLGTGGMNVGDSAMGAHMHMMSHAAPTMEAFRASDLKFPCDSVAANYQPSCWAYQPLVIGRLMKYDFDKTLAACAEAPPAALENCYQGFGKQSLGWYSWSDARVIRSCRQAGQHVGDCLAGGVEGLVDLTLDASKASAFCTEVPEQEAGRCFESIGARIARIHHAPADVQRQCAAAAKPAFVSACLTGARRV